MTTFWNGLLLAAFISRYASLFDGFRRDLIKDDGFEKILLNDLRDGIHINEYPDRICAEIVQM
jgi:hypothetical protein